MWSSGKSTSDLKEKKKKKTKTKLAGWLAGWLGLYWVGL
jgi:hypothetical protein